MIADDDCGYQSNDNECESDLVFSHTAPTLSTDGDILDVIDNDDEEETKLPAKANEKDEIDITGRTNVIPVEEENVCKKCQSLHIHSHAIQSELEKFMKMQDSGLSTGYKCPKCRRCKECLRGPGQEMLSMQQEAEQQLIRDSVRIDSDMNRALAYLAFTADPALHLNQNMHIAVRRMKNVCRKYGKNEDVKKLILKGFNKLIDRGHIVRWEDLTNEQRQHIEGSSDAYCIPWDVGFKETSLSTPARPTFDASSKTQ